MSSESKSAGIPSTSSFTGIDHVKIACSSLRASREFYTTILPFTHVQQFDHLTPDKKLYAQILRHEPTKTLLEIRYNPEHARRQKGWDPVTWGVRTRQDLDGWAAWLDEKGVKRSRIFTAIKSWVMVCEDPDGKMVRFYVSEEEHEWTTNTDSDEYWLSSPIPDPES